MKIKLKKWHEFSKGRKIFTISFYTFIAFVLLVNLADTKKNKEPVKTPAEIAADARETLIERQFSGWDGAHRNLERLVKRNLVDPDSYEHIETRYFDLTDSLRIIMKYRARNGFGGMTIGQVVAIVTLDGQVIEITENK